MTKTVKGWLMTKFYNYLCNTKEYTNIKKAGFVILIVGIISCFLLVVADLIDHTKILGLLLTLIFVIACTIVIPIYLIISLTLIIKEYIKYKKVCRSGNV